ncbi:TVP38/TMEM64 family protein [candidate division WWE3 bacterium]|uniref:TVP38/TMEM64 family membrane protein n=1 Tax=candidate division WWE3 bacterium TaxID=2053526 RepID=A0A955LLG1_UNCKA|nr:TVP38/TMEM64 family protein [candidate division WWE3 bacterium]
MNIKQYLSIKNVILVVLIIVFVLVISSFVTKDWMINLVESLGPLGPLGVVIYVVISHILTPVAGSPGIVLSVGLFGILETMVLTYVGGLISATIAFFISKKLGRPIVRRLAGEDTFKEIDNLVDVFDEKLLVVARLFGFPLFDVVSYAAGLTPLSYKNYMIITVIVSAIPSFTVNYIFQFVDFNSPTSILMILGFFIVIGAIFILIIRRYISGVKAKKLEVERTVNQDRN